MVKKDPRVDEYIAKAADFAKPVLQHFRELVHSACPETQETIKWGFPHFDYLNAPMCSMASFKQHCAVSFWKAALMKGGEKLVDKAKTEEAMGHLGRITSVKDLPGDTTLKKYIKEAMRLNEEGIKIVKVKPTPKKEVEVPDYFTKALNKNKKAKTTFDAFSPSHRREYLSWITEAKTEETRSKRMTQALEWMSEGKNRNWKYQKK